MQCCKTVINLAGRTGLPENEAETAEFFAVNRDAVRGLAETAMTAGIERFIHVSSTGVFGPGEGVFDEKSDCHPVNIYEESKLAGERALLAMDAPSMEITVVRPSNVFGEHHPWNKLLTWMRSVERNRVFLAGDPTRYWVNYIYVGDVAETLSRLLQYPGRLPEILILNTPVTVRSFFDATVAALDLPGRRFRSIPVPLLRGAAFILESAGRWTGYNPPLTCEKVAELTNTQVFRSHHSVLDVLGFPTVGLARGLGLTAAWYREKGLL